MRLACPTRLAWSSHHWSQRCGSMLGSRCTKVWNRAGVRLEACDFLERRAHSVSEQPRVWRGGADAVLERGIKILGTSLGHPEYVSNGQFGNISRSCWTAFLRFRTCNRRGLFLQHCASPRAEYFIRVDLFELFQEFANSHDEALRRCLSGVLGASCGGDSFPPFGPSEGWDCGAQVGQPLHRVGPVDPMR